MPDENHTYDELETTLTIKCPLCRVDIPMPHRDTATSDGLSIELDSAVADEHIEMHLHCTCRWHDDGDGVVSRYANPDCQVHR